MSWDISYNETGELLLWGPCLWDIRAPQRVRKFDMFGETWGSSNFHPAGLEAILNTEVHIKLCLLDHVDQSCMIVMLFILTL